MKNAQTVQILKEKIAKSAAKVANQKNSVRKFAMTDNHRAFANHLGEEIIRLENDGEVNKKFNCLDYGC